MPPIFISAEGIAKLIDNLKSSSTPRRYDITTKILKGTREVSCQILQIIFSKSFSTSSIPDDRKRSKVVPVFKAGDRSDPSNYRPISLTSIVCKMLEHIIYSQVTSHLDNNSFFFSQAAWFPLWIFLRYTALGVHHRP